MSTERAPQAILFDLDGTLSDSLSVMKDAYQRFLKQFGMNPTDEEFRSLNGPPLLEVVRRLKSTHHLEGSVEALYQNYCDILDDTYFRVRPCSGAQELLQTARDSHCVVGVVTSNSASRTGAWLKTVGLSHLVNFVVSGDDVTHGKPHPAPYLEAAKRASCPKVSIVAVEDSPQGARSATEAGIKTLAIVRDSEKNEAWPHGVVVVSTLEEVAKHLW